MRSSWVLALVCLLPGCASLSNDCTREMSELRAADAAIAHASRAQKRGFTAQLASRGHATYDCVSARSGQVHCTKAARPRQTGNINALYWKRDAAAARVSQYCNL